MREKDRELAMRLGITYLRAGDYKGSLLVKQGFERLGYVCLHTNGETPMLFRQKRKGFQIWTAEALREKGFSAENAPYYAVICFDSTTPIPFEQNIDLHKKRYTQVAHILPFGDFVSVE